MSFNCFCILPTILLLICLISASLSQEKAEIESKFLAERKRYKKEKDELSSEINKLKTNEQSLK